jgi:1-deoxy-D-xylulose-5-phosphate synthase
MRFVKPLDVEMVTQLAQQHELLVTIEENVITGGAGSAVNECLQALAHSVPVLNLGLPDEFIEHGNATVLLSHHGLDTPSIVRAVTRRLSLLQPNGYLTDVATRTV